MKIVLTGATGYLGKRVCKKLIEANHCVYAIVRTSTNTKILENFEDAVNFVIYDESINLEDTLSNLGDIDIVIHAATCYGRKGEDVSQILKSNILFPLDVLKSSLQNNVKLFINISSLLPKNLNLYSLSKSHFSGWGHMLSRDTKLKFIDVFLEYMYGGSIYETGFIAEFTRKLLAGDECIDLTLGTQLRDFVHVDDVVDALLYLIDNQEKVRQIKGNEIQIGTGKTISMREALLFIANQCDGKTKLNFGAIPYRKGESMHMCADISTLQDLGYSQSCFRSAIDGLQEFVESASLQIFN